MKQTALRVRNTANAVDQREGGMPTRPVPLLASLALIAALAPAISVAAPIGIDAMFAANARSIWTEGAGFSYNTNQFFGPTPINEDKTVGKIIKECVFGFCAEFGAELGARVSASAGIPYGLKVESGTFDVHYPMRLQFDVPTSFAGGPGNPTVTIPTSMRGLTGLSLPNSPTGPSELRGATLQVRGPDIQAYVDLSAEVHAFAGARACAVGCYTATPTFGPFDFSGSKEIAAINRNGDGEIRVLGHTYSSNQSVSLLNGLLNASFNLPNLDSSSAYTDGAFLGGNLTSRRRDSVAVLNANIAQIVLSSVGLGIPLSGNYAGFGYNLLQVNGGLSIDVRETLTFVPSATTRLLFSSEVIPRINNVDQAPTRIIDFFVGDDVTFTPFGRLGEIGVIPMITLSGNVHNRLDLVLAGHVDIQALGVNIFGEQVGPLVNETFASDELFSINLLEKDIHLELGTVTGSPFSLNFSECVAQLGPNEFPKPGICGLSFFTPGSAVGQGNGSRVDELVRILCDSYDPFDPADSPDCRSSSTGIFTNPYFERGSIDTFLGTAEALSFAALTPGPNTTFESQALLLASLGNTGTAGFIIPTGDPFPTFVPEPATGALLGLAFVGLLAVRARRPKGARQVSSHR